MKDAESIADDIARLQLGGANLVAQEGHRLFFGHPGIEADAASPAGRLSARGGPRPVFPGGQRSFPPSAVFPAVIPHFWCRAVMEWPRAAFPLTMSLMSPENQAARVNCCFSAILFGAPFSESEQLGSQTRTASPTSKPVSPVVDT